MALQDKKEKKGIQSKYVQTPNGRILLNNSSLSKMSEMTAINVQGFEDPVPETVDQLEEMIANAIKKPKKDIVKDKSEDDFDFSKANTKSIVKQAKERFGVELDAEGKDITELRTEYELLTKTIGETNDDTGSGSD